MDELTHHGILGMKWGVRRYQNADGSLTSAGRKRYGTKDNFEKVQNAKAQAKAATKKAKKQAKVDAEIAKYKKKAEDAKNGNKEETAKTNQKSASKPIIEMTDDEIRNRIQRIKLENELKSLTPETTTKGQKFLKGVGDVVVPSIKDASKDALTKYLKKQLSSALGVDEKSIESAASKAKKESERLKREAEDAENRKKKTLVDDFYAERERRQKEREDAEKIKNADRIRRNDREKMEEQYRAKKEAEVDKEIEAKIKESEKKNKQYEKEKRKAEKAEEYEYTVVGEGTSRRETTSKWDVSDAVDTDFRMAEEDPATDAGRKYLSYYTPLALDDPNKKK